MTRRGVQRLLLGHFHFVPEVHHQNTIADVFDNGQVMGDEDQRQAHGLLQRLEQVDDLRLNRDIERRHRLIADDELGLQNQGPGNAYALALAARKLVRVAVDLLRRQADAAHHRLDALHHLGLGHAGVVRAQGLGNDLRDGHARVQRGQRVLKNHLDVFSDSQPGLARGPGHFLAHPDDAAGAGGDQVEHGARQGRLAATGLAHHAQCFSRMNVERDTIDGLQSAGRRPGPGAARFDLEVHFQIAHRQNRLGRLTHGSLPWPRVRTRPESIYGRPGARPDCSRQPAMRAVPRGTRRWPRCSAR